MSTPSPTSREKIITPVIANYEPKKQYASKGSANSIYAKYKAEMNNVPAQQVAGSTLPLVEIVRDEEANYNPFEHRKNEHPTSDGETLVHLLKGSLGSGILAMPLAFLNAGLWFGLGATLAVGAICTYCVHILVKCAHILCRRKRIPSLGFADIGEVAFLDGPEKVHKYSRLMRFLINMFLVVDLLGCCCIYLVFVGTNLKQVVDFYLGIDWSVRIYIVLLLVPLILINLVRNLKFLTPFSMVANVMIGASIVITLYYILQDLPDVTERPSVADFTQWPLFFGCVIFALEGIGVVMSLENSMKNPTHFIGCPGVLNFGMGTVIILYSTVGFLGYLKFGPETEGSITLNLPVHEGLAQSVKLMIALAIFFTYALQFYVPMEIIWKGVKDKVPDKHKNIMEYVIRVSLVVFTVVVAVAVPNLGPFISLIGAVCLSMLGLIFPSLIELVVYWERPGLGRYNWILWKNVALMCFGVVGFITGTYVSLLEIIHSYKV